MTGATAMADAAIDGLLSAALRGEVSPWPAGGDATHVARVLARARYHGITGLLCEHAGRLVDWPDAIRDATRAHAIAAQFWEEQHRRLIAEALAALASIGVEAVLLKGTALAYGHYAQPAWRTRADTDMIVAEPDADRAARALQDLGFVSSAPLSLEVVSRQKEYVKHVGGNVHAIDLHRRLADAELLSRLLDHSELRSEAAPLPALSPQALGASPVHALLVACLHRAGHRINPYYLDGRAHLGGDRLIWIYDIHLLAGSLEPGDWGVLVSRATAKGLCAVCLDGLAASAAHFATPVPDGVRAALCRSGEPVTRYLSHGPVARAWMDMAAMPAMDDRLRYIREILFPPAGYMRARYPRSPRVALPLLYARRAVEGLAGRLGGGR